MNFNIIVSLNLFEKLTIILFSIVLVLIGLILVIQTRNTIIQKRNNKYRRIANIYLKFPNRTIKKNTLIPEKQYPLILQECNRIYNKSDNFTKQKLRNFLIKNKLDEFLKDNVIKSVTKKKIKNKDYLGLYIHTLGNFNYSTSTDGAIEEAIKILLESQNHKVSFECLLYIVKCSLRENFDLVLDKIIRGENLSVIEKQYIAKYFDNNVDDLFLNEIIDAQLKEDEVKIINFLSLTRLFPLHSIRIILEYKKYHQESVCAAIRALNNKNNLIEAFNILKTIDNWVIQVNLVNSIAKFKFGRDSKIIVYLVKCLKSSNWWLRNRAAFALVSSFGQHEGLIINLIENVDDQYASEALIYAHNESSVDLEASNG